MCTLGKDTSLQTAGGDNSCLELAVSARLAPFDEEAASTAFTEFRKSSSC